MNSEAEGQGVGQRREWMLGNFVSGQRIKNTLQRGSQRNGRCFCTLLQRGSSEKGKLSLRLRVLPPRMTPPRRGAASGAADAEELRVMPLTSETGQCRDSPRYRRHLVAALFVPLLLWVD